MLFTSLNQYIVLALLLIVGWAFGFASNGGAKKWRARYKEENAANAVYRHETDAQLRDANRRIAELERENAAYVARPAEPVAAPTAVSVFPARQTPVATDDPEQRERFPKD